MKTLIQRDEQSNVSILLDSERAPTAVEKKGILGWYRNRPHHDKDSPESNRIIVIKAAIRFGIMEGSGLAVQCLTPERTNHSHGLRN